ncbi:MAG TPA: deoxyribose-phosphate aldolase [Tissierellales bacterium]|nr:deoxyribose-phosphate aldolase [Tissierellales bacterium]
MKNLSKYIDHTLLKPETTKDMVKTLCEEAKEYGFYSVCINPTYVNFAKEQLKDSDVKVATVIGFPLGSTMKEVKAYESENAINNGADELDMVINIGALKDKDYDLVKEDIEEVVNAAKGKALVKVIIETCLLNEEEKKMACKLAKEAGADFVKTSTGFSTAGATKEDVKLMREVVGDKMGVKASGGIRDYETAVKMIEVGATRLGASSSIKIIQG